MFNYRKANVEDIPLIRQLTLQVWPQTYASIISQEQIDYMLTKIYAASVLEEQINSGNTEFILVFDEDIPIGFASFGESGPTVFKLHKIYVLPSQQSKGTGKWAIDRIIEYILDKGATSLQLQVNRFNKARHFYEKLGFKVIAEADFDIGEGYFMNDYVMEKKLIK